ncbi:MAG: hypothetical protein J7L15_09490 [Clostridiales bacterium]|nr:hypothetical protein [Clostridiales bacterium]
MKIEENVECKIEAIKYALFEKITNMISDYINYNHKSPIIKLRLNSIEFVPEFQNELEKHMTSWENAKKVLLERLIIDAKTNKENYERKIK